MLSLYKRNNDSITIDGNVYPIDFNFNVVLANLELSQDTSISDRTKVKVALQNYLDVKNEQLSVWSYEKQRAIYLEISLKLFSDEVSKCGGAGNEDKASYSFVEDADYIYASFLKDYNINLIKERNKMHWNEFKALFVSLSDNTKMVEVMRVRSWKPTKDSSEEQKQNMAKLKEIYALKTTQAQLELIELERQKMREMTPEERVAYAKQQLKRGGV